MPTDHRLLTSLLAAGIVAVSGGPHYHWTTPPVRCGIPDRQYQYYGLSPSRRAVSTSVVVAPLAPEYRPRMISDPGVTPPAVKTFQFVQQPILSIDHCSLRRISVMLNASGEWSVSMVAEQNPLPSPQGVVDVTSSERTVPLARHLLRNEFHIEIRCYGGPGTARVDSPLGQPLVIPLRLTPVWVQREQPLPVYQRGVDPRVRDYYSWIDHVEIEFAYRTN